MSGTKSKRSVTPSKQRPRKAPAPKAKISTALEFMKDDAPRTLFPLNTNLLLAELGQSEIHAHISDCIDESNKETSFLVQQRAYAAKPESHLRRTVKLDPVAEYYLYELVYRNRALFRRPHAEDREHFGYRFEKGDTIASTDSYRAFRGAISEYRKKYKHFISFDVASYFNGVYHHDLVNWFREIGANNEDVSGFGQLLREINSGRSIDCLPQGLYPAKMIGNDFLRFVDNHFSLKAKKLIRFMDDFYLFSDSMSDVEDDFILIQELLGSRGLSINAQKTSRNETNHIGVQDDITKMKKDLLQRRRLVLESFYDDDVPDEFIIDKPLSAKELDYVDQLLKAPTIEEEDVELVLTIMRENTQSVEKRLPEIILMFPNLTKNVFSFCRGVDDKELVASAVIDALKHNHRHLEFQLFWFAKMLEEYLMDTSKAREIIGRLLESPSATPISKAKVLEIRDRRYGLTEMREKYLMSGQSDWTAWASASGSLSLKKGSRNHVLKYFGNSSKMNHLIASVVGEIE
ncbi:MAG: RNA-directed DNA polymerase [Loktanella sp.]|nr:RNA-directed DNA polymerase [Loktanella sp.]